MAAEGHPVRATATLLRVSESGYYAWRRRAPSGRLQRHAWLTELIVSIHRSSRDAYGSRRIHHELRQHYGVSISRGTVELLMRQAGIKGRTGRSRWTAPQAPDDRVPRRLWVTDARAHPTPGGTVYCAVVLDVDRRRLMGWSTERTATHELVRRALNTALTGDTSRLPPAPTPNAQHTRYDRHTPWTTYAFTDRVRALALSPGSAPASDRRVQASVDRFWVTVDRHLPPRQNWNSPGNLQEELKRLLGTFASHPCRFDESCACGPGGRGGIPLYPKPPVPEIPGAGRLAPS
ncbi:IS3 family transposase [Streptomyces sp. NPDC059618]|uniref:IS3 family transposase n=1 Tax=Streptomyces sp. NPDC059618 TaxID=3346887 RepID=UPI00369E702D